MEDKQKIDVYNVYLEMGWDTKVLLKIVKNLVDPRLQQNEHEK